MIMGLQYIGKTRNLVCGIKRRALRRSKSELLNRYCRRDAHGYSQGMWLAVTQAAGYATVVICLPAKGM